MAPPRFHALAIATLHRETADSTVLGFAVPAALRAAYMFTPGQFLTLRIITESGELRRPYSICSDPAELDTDGVLRVGIRHLPGGRFSGLVASRLAAGGRLDVMTPDGRFGIAAAPGSHRTLLFCAAGSGITPILSILRATLTREAGRCVLFYANRARATIMFRAEIEALKDRYLDRLAVVHLLSRERQETGALAGRLDPPTLARLLAGAAPLGVDRAFLCGPAAMTDALAPVLAASGLAEAAIHRERFVAAEAAPENTAEDTALGPAPSAEAAQAASLARAAVIFAGLRSEFPVGPDETIIAAGQRAGLDLPYACRGGMCCTCRARLTEGAVTMAVNYGLEPWEVAAGYVLTCQSRPRTPFVALDYDQV